LCRHIFPDTLSAIMKKFFVLLSVCFLLLIGIMVGSVLASTEAVKSFIAKHIGVFFPSDVPSGDKHEYQDEYSMFPQIALSDQALENIGIKPQSWRNPIKEDFPLVRSFPAMLVERPGRSTFQISASVSGVIRRVYCEQGERVRPGQPLFDIMLTHEDIVQCQTALLALCQKKIIVDRELERLKPLQQDQIAPKTIREFENQKIEIDAQIAAQKNLLLLHGLSAKSVEALIQRCTESNASEQFQLIQELTIYVPNVVEDGFLTTPPNDVHDDKHDAPDVPLVLQHLNVEKGQLVSQGETLCQISNYSRLYVEGKAFARDEPLLNRAFTKQSHVSVVFDDHALTDEKEPPMPLHIKKLDNRIDAVNRTLNFYVELNNRLLDVKERWDDSHHAGHSHLDTDNRERLHWRFKPGQRCVVNVEHQIITDCFVVPAEAVAEDGAEAFVFAVDGISKWRVAGNAVKQLTIEEEESGIPYFPYKIWHKKPIKIEARDQHRIAFKPVFITAPDSNEAVPSVLPTDYLAQTGASQLNDAFNSGSGKLQSTCPCGDH